MAAFASACPLLLASSATASAPVLSPARRPCVVSRPSQRSLVRMQKMTGPEEAASDEETRATSEASNVAAPPESTRVQIDACDACGRNEGPISGCDGSGRIAGGVGAVFDWWPIKAYRPCPELAKAKKQYKKSGQSLDEIAFGRK